MGRINLDDADKFSNGGNPFFQLKDDGDTEVVRIMYGSIDDVDAFLLHRVEINGQQRYVSCLRENPDDDASVCPLCASGSKTCVRLFIPMYSVKDKVVKFWERGKNMIKKLQSLCSRYNPLYDTPIEIERCGKAGDNQTSYNFYAQKEEPVDLEELPEVPDIMGSYILDKSAEELEEFVKTGKMPGEEASNRKSRNVEDDGVRRRGSSTSRRSRREQF